MTTGKRRPTRRQLRSVCGEMGPDDGVDPRVLARARMRQHRDHRRDAVPQSGPGRKARQLGRQVAETLDAVFAGDARDELLRGLRVVSAVPAPDAGRLLVTVEPLPPVGQLDPAGLVARLERASGWLRTEVAAAITRRRAPLLTFRLLLPG